MEYSFNSDEFTTRDLVTYLKRAYGHQVNGNSFSWKNIEDWQRVGRFPDAYGGNKILRVDVYPQLNDLRVFTVEHLNREEIEDVFGSLSNIKSTLQKEKAKLNKPKRVRTELYYQTLGTRGKRPKSPAAVMPNNWQETGIKANQLHKHKVKKK